MSNSDSTSNSDSKLDALYKLTQLNDSVLSEDNSAEDMSPPDIDATILAAAREATTDELGPPEGNKEESRESASKTSILSWQRRFGWATAATVLLTSVLFISLVDNEPQMGTLSRATDRQANDAAVVELSPAEQSRVRADTDAAMKSVSASNDFETIEPELEFDLISDRGAPKARVEVQKEVQSLQEKPSPVIEEILVRPPTMAQESDSVQVERAQLQRERSNCLNYPEFLISQVCTYPHALSTTTELRASQQSGCAGQTLTLSAGSEPPKPHDSSTPDRFVIQHSDTAKPPTEEIVCQSGKLVRQSLARGR